MIVVDVGAQHHPPEESTLFLIERFQPRLLFAFDAINGFEEGVELHRSGTVVVSRRAAAWTHADGMPYHQEGMVSGVTQGVSAPLTPTFDLAALINVLPPPLVLKLDCEGAEYVLMPHLRDTGVNIALLLIEWHAPHHAHGFWVPPEQRVHLDCEEQDWNDLTGLETVNR